MLLVGMKNDLKEDKSTLERLETRGTKPISKEEGENMAKELKAFAYRECSALTQEGLKDVFDTAVRAVTSRRTDNPKKKKKIWCSVV